MGSRKDQTDTEAENLTPQESLDDPPRNWRRVGAMAGVWGVVLAIGAWVGPGFAAGGEKAEEDKPVTEQAPKSPSVAAYRYLKFGTLGQTDSVAVCEGSDPDVSIGDLQNLAADFEEKYGKSPFPEVEVVDDSESDGRHIADRVLRLENGASEKYEMTVTVKEAENGFCVENAEYGNGSTEGGDPGATVEPDKLAVDYLTRLYWDRSVSDAAELQCDGEYEGVDAQELVDAITAQVENKEASSLAGSGFEVNGGTATVSRDLEIQEGAQVRTESFTVGIDMASSCVVSLQGGEGLLGE
ncbi:hypothetical protein [Salininema proteolyticum]|uniref:Uncharacterized protein n=1 Tax=Salininema proteolyticum TaxID=1607685 RepID=A0ABV8U1S2_9ACTN